MARRARKQRATDLTPEVAAAMTFEPMRLDDVQSREDFMKAASDLYTFVVVAADLLKKNPKAMGEAIASGFGDRPDELFEAMKWAQDWAGGWKKIAGCVEARALIAMSQRCMGMHA